MTCQTKCTNAFTLDLAKLSEYCYIQQFITGCLAQFAYYIETNDKVSVIIDPLRDIDQYLKLIEERGSKLKYILVTHFHADFVAGHYDLAIKTGAEIVFGPEAKPEFKIKDIKDGEILDLSDKIKIKIIHTPGHTLESTCFLLLEINQNKEKQLGVFTGDTLFLGDTGRPDLAMKSDLTSKDLASLLYDSVQNLKKLDDECVIFPGHGAGSACGKNIQSGSYSTIGLQKKTDIVLSDNLKKEEFIEMATSDLQTPPSYFFIDVAMNQKAIPFYEEIMKKSFVPIEVEEFDKLIQDELISTIDSRTIKSVNEQGLPYGAINVTIDNNYAIYAATIFNPKNKMIIIAEEGREYEAVSRLTRVGFENILGYLKGGINSWISAQKPLSKLNLILKDEAKKITENGYVLDVRTSKEFKCPGHIKSSIMIPLGELENNLEKIDKSKKILILCRSGIRATMAATILLKHGFNKDLAVIEGGILNLIEKGISIEN